VSFMVGGTLLSSLKILYDEGGISRLYQGLPFALIQVCCLRDRCVLYDCRRLNFPSSPRDH
jgi:hypothetical protein